MMLLIGKDWILIENIYVSREDGFCMETFSERNGTQEKRLSPKRERSKTAETVPKRKESTEKRNDSLKTI